MNGLTVSVGAQEGAGASTTLVRLAGEADVTTTELHDVLSAEAAKRPRRLIIELSGLTFMDSAALHAIISVYRELRAAGSVLSLAGPLPSVARLLELSGADQVIPVYASTEEALGSAAADRDEA